MHGSIELWRGSRRQFLVAAAVGAGTLCLPVRGRAGSKLTETVRTALEKSPLVYVSPLKRDGSESTCHGEVWFVRDGEDVLVVTASERWKARAVRLGLTRTRLWVGDFGVWKRSDRFRSGPSFEAEASFESDSVAIEKALEAFGTKYADEWDKWGPRFRKGLAEGSRVLIRYRPAGS